VQVAHHDIDIANPKTNVRCVNPLSPYPSKGGLGSSSVGFILTLGFSVTIA
jgi:hypothetical protein